jgi:hypothetical protein
MTADDRKLRLRRLDRIFARTSIYYVTACTHNRRQILACDSVHQSFMDFAREAPAAVRGLALTFSCRTLRRLRRMRNRLNDHRSWPLGAHKHRYSYREYNSTINCSLTIG